MYVCMYIMCSISAMPRLAVHTWAPLRRLADSDCLPASLPTCPP